MKFRSLLLALALGSIATLSSLPAQAVSIQELQYSSGSSQYKTQGGQWVSAQVELQGNQGSYQTAYGTGQLYNVQYNQFNTGVNISGLWSLNGQSGTFQWFVGYNYSFSGSWWFQPNQRWPWNGSLSPSNAGGGNCGYPGGPACPGDGGNNGCGYPGGPACPTNCGYPGGPACP